MKIKLTDFLLLVMIAALLWFYVIEPNTEPQPPQPTAAAVTPALAPGASVVATQAAPVVLPTNPVPVIVETWTPFFVMPTATAQPISLPNDGHTRTGITPGTVGNHDPGRTDHRTP
jgi:hypothetical protein